MESGVNSYRVNQALTTASAMNALQQPIWSLRTGVLASMPAVICASRFSWVAKGPPLGNCLPDYWFAAVNQVLTTATVVSATAHAHDRGHWRRNKALRIRK